MADPSGAPEEHLAALSLSDDAKPESSDQQPERQPKDELKEGFETKDNHPIPSSSKTSSTSAPAHESSTTEDDQTKNVEAASPVVHEEEPQKNSNICHQFNHNGKCGFGFKCKFLHLPGRKNIPNTGVHTLDSPINQFFAQYPTFKHYTKKPLNDQFARLRRHLQWDKDEQKDAYKQFRIALVMEFNYIYGKDEYSLELWQKLAGAVAVRQPTSVSNARWRIRHVEVNLFDLVENPRTNVPVEVFLHEGNLREYCLRTGRIFPRENDYAGDLLKVLLREIGSKKWEEMRQMRQNSR